MIQQQVDEVFIAGDLKAELTAHEGIQSAHLAQEVLDTVNQRTLQFPFAVLVAEFQEIERILVLHGELRLCP